MERTIKEVKQELALIEDLNSSQFDKYLQDKRIGAQKAVESRKRQLFALKKENERLENLLFFERELYQKGYKQIAGIDEVGRGPLAGPVIAAAVILPENCKIPHLNDSKQIPKSKHEEIYEAVMKEALAVGIGSCSESVIDEINIYQASKRAMVEAVSKLEINPDYLLIDAMKLEMKTPEISLIKGDARSMSIAAASIVAKVTRDRLMQDYAQIYPGYDFEHNVGYGTKKHLEGLKNLGLTPIHRKTFSPVASYL